MELSQASHQWSTRPADERFTSLPSMLDFFESQRRNSRESIIASRRLTVQPLTDHKGIEVIGPSGGRTLPSHWAFGQLAALAEAPAGYLRTMPAEIVSDCLNYGLQYKRQVEDVGTLLRRQASGDVTLSAATGPRYGRIWNRDICQGVIDRFGRGDGSDGSPWTVPGEFGHAVQISKDNTTLFAGDRDMFVFLADEKNRVELPAGIGEGSRQRTSLARGFFVKNSEVGDATLSVSTFLFDYVCCNRIVWGARQYKSIAIRHTPKAPVRWADEVILALERYRESPTASIAQCIEAARLHRLDDPTEFLARRFGKRLPVILQDVSMDEEQRPIETIWDAVTAVTAYAHGLKWQNERVELETKAGEMLDLVAMK